MDTIALDVDLDCIVGLLPRERVTPQPLRIALRLDVDLGEVGATGDLDRGVDYAAIDAEVRFLATEGRFRLIESLALVILRVVLVPPVVRAAVRVTKPAVLPGSVPAVELARDASWARTDRLAQLPEVDVDRRLLVAGDSVPAGVAFGLAGVRGPLSVPYTATRACSVLVINRRA